MDELLGWRLLYRTSEELIAMLGKSSFGKNGAPLTPAPGATSEQPAHATCAGCHISVEFGGNETQLMVVAVKNGGNRPVQAAPQPRL